MAENLAPEIDVIVSSRVRLARNYADLPFVSTMKEDAAAECVCRAMEALEAAGEAEQYKLFRMADLGENERGRLVEHQLVSYDLLKSVEMSAALVSVGETITVMVNEEDHLRLQGLLPGLQLERAAEMAFHVDDMLGARAAYAFDTQWGYLTSCPTAAGTGMRVSVMLHLPALTRTAQVGQVQQSVSRLGLTLRGVYGDGSDARGCLYLLSNQTTLGRTEDDMLSAVASAATQLAERERALREHLRKTNPIPLMDGVMRSAGICANARIMNLQEFMQRYADLRLGAALKLLRMHPDAIDKLMMDMQPASLGVKAGRDLPGGETDVFRAEQIRARVAELAEGKE